MTARLPAISLGALLSLSLAACAAREDVDVREPPPSAAGEAVQIGDLEGLASMRLDRVRIAIRRGTVIGEYYNNIFPCGGSVSNIEWNRGRVAMREVEFSDLFFEEMKLAGFNVIGDPEQMFESRDQEAADYLVGAQVTEIRMEVCKHISFWSGQLLGVQSGKASVRVDWQFFSPLRGEVVYETTTDGFVRIEEPRSDGEVLLLTEAFADAAARLSDDVQLVEILSSDEFSVATPVPSDRIKVAARPKTARPIEERIDRIRRSVVTITDGLGHGSGFFISPRHVVTNHHVVRGRDTVRIATVTGAEHLAEVIRYHPERDVALLAVEDRGFQPLPIREKPLSIAEEVYAVGTPLDPSLGATVTKGIVSALRANRFGLPDIQADVDIQPGNSGGPLLDKHGNVVGISYAGLQNAGTSIGVNFFVPIGDGLDHLGVEIE